MVQPGRAPLAACLMGPSMSTAAPNIVIAGASIEKCHRPFHPTVAVGSL